MAGVGPMFGQLGFFYKFAGKEIEDKRPLERYVNESKRLMGVLEARLKGREWLMGEEYTVADIATFPWVRTLRDFYEADEIIGFNDFPETIAWLERCLARPASQKGLTIPARG